jgi:hypothetical protein
MRRTAPLLAVLLALAGCVDVTDMDATPPESDAPTPGECVLEASLEVDRVRGVFPMPLHGTVTSTCPEGDVFVTWDTGDGHAASGPELDYSYTGSGTFVLSVVVASGEASITLEQEIEVGRSGCPTAGLAVVLGSIASDEIDEASGLAHSRKDDGILWTHNDSGDTARLFAMSIAGDHLGSFILDGAASGDWEDSTIGVDPSTGETRLYIGDIGDNSHTRETVLVHIVDEPDLDPAGGDQSAEITGFATIEIDYPHGESLDSETLLFDPVTGDLYLVGESEDGDVDLYRKAAPHEDGSRSMAERVSSLTLDGRATGGDFAPDGHLFVVRTGTTAYAWVRDRSKEFVENLFAEPCEFPLPSEVRGEGLAFSGAGDGFFTVSEETHQPIHFVPIEPARQPCKTLEAHIVALPPGGTAPVTTQFSLDPECLFEELVSISWDLGDGSDPITEAIHSVSYTSEGIHTVRVDIEDATGAISSDELTFEVTQQICPTTGDVEEWGSVDAEGVVEASGLVHSFANPGVLWTHNDSGSGPELFAIGEDGANLGTYTLDTTPRDWEDIATGFNLELNAQALYVGDVGDNAVARSEIKIYIVEEPTVDLSEEEVVEDLPSFGLMTLNYPDGPHNCESIFIDPITGALVLITKNGTGATAIYQKPAPHIDGWSGDLEFIASLDFSQSPFSGSRSTTAADIHPEGNLIAIRTYSDVWLFRRDPTENLGAAFSRPPCNGNAPNENQGEAIAFSTDGSGYIVLSEGEHQPIKYRSVVPVPAR